MSLVMAHLSKGLESEDCNIALSITQNLAKVFLQFKVNTTEISKSIESI